MTVRAHRAEGLRLEAHHGRVVACRAERLANVNALWQAALDANRDGEAVVDGGERLTYAELDERIARLAGGLAACGIGPGDRVAVRLGNSAAFVALVFAIARLGAILVPINVREEMEGMRHLLTDCGAALIVTEAEHAAAVPPPAETPACRNRFSIGAADGFRPYRELEAGAPVRTAAPVHEDETAAILYTSGTTGRSKGALLTHLGIVHQAATYRELFALTPADCTVLVVPMSHVTGLMAGIHATVAAAGRIVAMRTFDAAGFLETAARERLTFTILVPAMYNLFLMRARLADYDLGAWRIGGYGGAPMPAPTIERLAEALPNLNLVNAYGATETTSPMTLMDPSETARRRLSVGLATPGAEIVVMDDAGREVPTGETGELWHAGPMIVPGYWNNPEATAREFVGRFWKSGDIGSIDADGFVYVHDRKKDMINRGGFKIYTAEVEGVLLGVPGVREAAVIAKPCIVLGERVHAVVHADAGVTADALALACSVLTDYQRPESFTFNAGPLPRNANGKVLKRHLREALGFVSP
ncbi:class I adenylate-forming enzyme family protein [Acuticoccus sediminis]|uniref:class I adenylate-forming enzyme family protein n=1 Tax=Acuticoccus sediminis TaxID=2184697 RepID=UPI001FD02C87|nr:class I adenylate-forming enzyme family protein [Acuticoccus sediminis]